MLIEETLLGEGKETLLKLILNVYNIISDVFQCELPSLSLFLFELLFLLQEVTVTLSFVIIHLLVWLIHPVFPHQLHFKQILIFFECKFTAHHDL